jgi:hypothetical protein
MAAHHLLVCRVLLQRGVMTAKTPVDTVVV